LHEEGSRREWNLPYVAIEPPQSGDSVAAEAPPAAATATAPRPGRSDLRCGDKVAFEDSYLQNQVGTVVRINQRTATVDTGNGHTWRVPFAMLRHVLDV
jgi:hypothetical protein